MSKFFATHQTDEETITREVTTSQLVPQYRVLLHNDDHNAMDYVCQCLIQVFGFTVNKAWAIMIEAHTNEMALCAVEPLESAEFHRDKLIAFGLLATIEEAEA